jgi:hypothetical protein
MQEVVSELTDKYPDVYVRNLAQKHMEDKQVNTDQFSCRSLFEFSQWKVDGIAR